MCVCGVKMKPRCGHGQTEDCEVMVCEAEGCEAELSEAKDGPQSVRLRSVRPR